MYCPKCGSDNIETARFCRKCGANIAYVSEPLAPDSAQTQSPWSLPWQRGGLSPARAAKNLSSGIALLCIAIFLIITHQRWGLWMLFPAFALLGKGISMIITIRTTSPRRVLPGQAIRQDAYLTPSTPAARPTAEIRPDTSSDIGMPPSVTEGTTRIMTPASGQYPERP
jgi:hypothetical protein